MLLQQDTKRMIHKNGRCRPILQELVVCSNQEMTWLDQDDEEEAEEFVSHRCMSSGLGMWCVLLDQRE